MMAVLDASALLAYLHDEPGSKRVEAVLPDSATSAVNLAEVIQKAVAREVAVDGLQEDLEALRPRVEPFTGDQAVQSGRLWKETRPLGLSLGDRACLGRGLALGLPVLTADRAWQQLTLGLEIEVIRP